MSLWKVITACALVLGVAAIGAHSVFAVRRPVDQALAKDPETVFKKGGFAAAAAQFGSYVRTEPPHAFALGPATVAELVRSGEVILVGRVISNKGVLAPSGESIRTHYTVAIQQVLKGGRIIQDREEVVVSILGGRAGFVNGTWGQLNVQYSEPPLNGRTYVFFLNRLPNDARSSSKPLDTAAADFWPARGFSGIVAVSPDGRSLRSADRRGKGNVAVRAHEADAGRFIVEIRRIATELDR